MSGVHFFKQAHLFGKIRYVVSVITDIEKSKCLYEPILNRCDFYHCSLNGLIMRFEPPDLRNRWDAPLFVVHPQDELPCEQIYDALYHKKAPPPNHSTLSVSRSPRCHEPGRQPSCIQNM